MTAEKPKLLMLEAITPSPDTAFSDRLEYSNLQRLVDINLPFERQRSQEYWDAESDSLEELSAAKGLATQYMLMGALALQRSNTHEGRAIWSDRYTLATSEMFGTPDADLARKLWDMQQSGAEFPIEPNVERAAAQVGEYLQTKYGSLYDTIEAGIEGDVLAPDEVADRFEQALATLVANHDEDWATWTIDRNEEKDSLSVVSPQKKIIVGQRRAVMPKDRFRGLFSHEVLVHALRAINGAKLAPNLATGLSGYLDAEEGMGIFVEYAVSGKVPESIVDKYVDTAYALGQVDGVAHTRQELLDHVTRRTVSRNESAIVKKSPEDIEKEVFAHVNRIYRGSLGNEHIGVFTKDIAYLNGFMKMGNYVADQLDEGKDIEEIMDYIMLGKFDPTIESHAERIASLLAST